MNFVILIAAFSFVTGSLSHPEGINPQNVQPECRLASLIPGGNLGIPVIDIGNSNESPIPPIADPLPIRNVSVTLKEDILSGTYSLRNGVITGLSTLTHNFNYNAIKRRIEVNATLQHGAITGDYEIIDGRANLTILGAHTFSGAGPLRGSISGVVTSLGLAIKMDQQTNHLSIEDLKIDFDFKNASILAENLILDGEPVNWDEVNATLKPTFDLLWGEAQQIYIQIIQDRINWLLEGCTLMDLIQLLKPPQ